jgi:hypothetical protein
MKGHLKLILILALLTLFCGNEILAQGSLLKKIKARAEDEVVDGIFGKKGKDGQASKYGDAGGTGQSRLSRL